MQDEHTARPLEPLPETLYRFRTFGAEGRDGRDEQSVFELLTGRLRFAPILSFNDPFEARPRHVPAFDDPAEQRAAMMRYLAETMPGNGSRTARRKRAERLLAATTVQELVERMSDPSARESLCEGVLVLCMSGLDALSTPLVWSHYADAHRGVCVHLNTRIAPISLALTVEYGSEYPSIPIPRTAVSNDDLMRNIVLRKCDLWSYEHEYRVIRTNAPAAHISNHLTVQWDGSRALASPNVIAGITLGALMPLDRRERLLAWIRANRPDIRVWQATLHPSQYRVISQPVQ